MSHMPPDGDAGHTPPYTPAGGASPQLTHKQAKALARSTRPWWKKKRFMIPLALVLVGILTKISSGGSSTEASTPSASTVSGGQAARTADAANTIATIGQTVKEGDIEFTIKSWKCGLTSIGSSSFNEKPQGQFCIASVVYKNVSNDPKTFDASMAMTARQGDSKYKPNSMASIEANDNDHTFLEEVNPGNSAAGRVVFDVPKTAKIDTINIVDGYTGDGTPIKVA